MRHISVFLMCLFVGVYTEETHSDYMTKLESFKADCIEESKVAPDLVERFLDEDYADDKNLKCFVKCLFVKMDVMNDDGDIVDDAFRTQLSAVPDKGKIDVVIQKCTDLKGNDYCETAYNVAKCTFGVLKTR